MKKEICIYECPACNSLLLNPNCESSFLKSIWKEQWRKVYKLPIRICLNMNFNLIFIKCTCTKCGYKDNLYKAMENGACGLEGDINRYG